jgi:ATP-dependent DNA helicase RecQ
MEAMVWLYPFRISLLEVSEGETMRSVPEGDDTLSMMATSSGKLVIYPMAAMVLRGPTVVLSLLIAVPCDRVDAITAQPDGGASLIHAAVRQPERRDALETLEEGEPEFRFLAPKLFDPLEMLGRLRGTR